MTAGGFIIQSIYLVCPIIANKLISTEKLSSVYQRKAQPWPVASYHTGH